MSENGRAPCWLSIGGNIAAVGRELEKARMQIHRWMQRYEIDIEDYR